MATTPNSFGACPCGLRGEYVRVSTSFQGFHSATVTSHESGRAHSLNAWWDPEHLRFDAVCCDTGERWRKD